MNEQHFFLALRMLLYDIQIARVTGISSGLTKL
jgi:hypothetical protein